MWTPSEWLAADEICSGRQSYFAYRVMGFRRVSLASHRDKLLQSRGEGNNTAELE